MKTIPVLALVLATGTLFAQDSTQDLDGRLQVFMEMSKATSIAVAQVNSVFTSDQPARLKGVGIRFLGEVASSPRWYYEIGGRVGGSSKFTLNGPIGGGYDLDDTGVKFKDNYWSIGGAYLYPAGESVSLGAHLEARGETLSIQGPLQQNDGTGWAVLGTASANTTYLRPWVRLSADVSFPVGEHRPYFGVEVSATPIKTTQTQFVQLVAVDDRTLKAICPTSTFSFYLGLHF